jgi:HPt (histidine-containing phosphotransfer) domain-containing protein
LGVNQQAAAGDAAQVRPDTNPEALPEIHGQQVVFVADSTPTDDLSRSTSERIFSSLPVEDPAFRSIVERFIETLPGKLEAMCAAWEDKDYGNLADLAHWLKGAGGTVGFAAFTNPAKRLESLAKERSADQIEETIDELLDLAGAIAIDAAHAEAMVCESA